MKKIILGIIISVVFAFAQDGDVIMTASEVPEDSLTITANPLSRKVDVEDYRKFYIGFSNNDASFEVITLSIKEITPGDSVVTFNYVLNSRDDREEGQGEIIPDLSLIRFKNMQEGRISYPDDGKIVFESLSQDSLNYWKLKEK